MNIFKTALTGVSLLAISSLGSTAYAQNFNIQSATGTGSHASFPPSNVLDGDLSFASRWAGNASPEEIRLDLGSNRTVDDIQIAWGRGDSRRYTFEVAGRSGTSGSWTNLFEGTSSGNTAGFENYNLTDRSVRQVRIRGLSNSSGTAYTDITEVTISGTGGQGSTPTPTPPNPTPTPTASSDGTFVFAKKKYKLCY